MKAYDHVAVIQLKEMPTGGSDVTLKREVVSITNALEKVLSLRQHPATSDMMPYVVGAIKNQHAKIAKLIDTLKAQQQEIARLTRIVENLEGK